MKPGMSGKKGGNTQKAYGIYYYYGNVDFLTFGHRDTDALRFENMDIAEELLSLTDGSACEQMRLSDRRSMGALFRCPHVVLM